MAKSRPRFPSQDVFSSAQAAVRSKEWEGPTRWTEYLSPEIASRNNGGAECAPHQTLSCSSQKGLNMQWVYQLTHVAEGLMTKMYRLNQILDYPDLVNHIYSEAFWKAGLFPNQPKICILLEKKFPEHYSKLQLERVDKFALDSMNDSAEVHLQTLEPWFQLLLDLMAFREQSLRLILDLSSTVITLLMEEHCCFYQIRLFNGLTTSFAAPPELPHTTRLYESLLLFRTCQSFFREDT
ncbi:histone chaperone [Orobanche minor]